MDPQNKIDPNTTLGYALNLCYRMAEACDYELVIAHSEDVPLSGPLVGYRGNDDWEVWATFDIRLVDAGFESQLADALARLYARVTGGKMWDGALPDEHEYTGQEDDR